MDPTIAKTLIENGGAAAVAVLLMAALFVPLLRSLMMTVSTGLRDSMHEVVEQLRELVATQNAASQSIQTSVLEAIRQGDATIVREMARNHGDIMKVLAGCERRNQAGPPVKETKNEH